MTIRSSISLCILALYTFFQAIRAHPVITYPGWRGNNLQTNGTVVESNGLGSFHTENGTIFPYGMKWQYPCGGMPMSENRTKWPVNGGAIAFQPGWFFGHKTAFMYFNLGLGNHPDNYSFVMQNGLNIIGPSAEPYPGTFCLPQVPLPAGLKFNVGDNATIQVVMAAIHGAALYDCVDITFADPADVEEVTPDNCFNSSQISSSLVFTTTDLETSSAASTISSRSFPYLFTAATIATMTLML